MMRSVLPPSVDSELDLIVARATSLPYTYTREQLNDAFKTFVVQNQGLFVSDWRSSPTLNTIHSTFHNYWFATNLGSMYETGQVAPVVTFAETVKNALFIWWNTAGHPQLHDAHLEFIAWYQ